MLNEEKERIAQDLLARVAAAADPVESLEIVLSVAISIGRVCGKRAGTIDGGRAMVLAGLDVLYGRLRF